MVSCSPNKKKHLCLVSQVSVIISDPWSPIMWLKQEGEALTRLLAVAISAFRMSGSYLLDEDDLEFTAGKEIRHKKRGVTDQPLQFSFVFLWYTSWKKRHLRDRRGEMCCDTEGILRETSTCFSVETYFEDWLCSPV